MAEIPEAELITVLKQQAEALLKNSSAIDLQAEALNRNSKTIANLADAIAPAIKDNFTLLSRQVSGSFDTMQRQINVIAKSLQESGRNEPPKS